VIAAEQYKADQRTCSKAAPSIAERFARQERATRQLIEAIDQDGLEDALARNYYL
jgi:hypothetical protein